MKSQILACRDFDELWHFINKAIKDISGVGELMIYDTTHRLGAFLNLAPEKVYIHRGVREGAKALGFNGKRESVELEELPKPMQRLSAYELEDILCIYKDDLKRLSSA